MKQIPFGRTGLKVSQLGFGSAPVGYLEETLEQTSRILNEMLDSGVNVIDTAPCYPNSEELIGQAVSHRRKDYVLVTKCGHQANGLQGEEWSPSLIRKSIERSLRLLKTDCLDVVVLHSCKESVLRQGEALGALVQAQDEGKLHFIGYSGDNQAAAYAAGLEEVLVIETSVNICDQNNIETVFPTIRERNLGALAKRPLANAAWKKAEEQRGLYQSYAEPYRERLEAMSLKPEDLGFSGPPEQVWPELALRFCLSVGGVDCAIVGTTRPENARANLEIIEKGPLPEDPVAIIREAFRRSEPEPGAWPGLT